MICLDVDIWLSCHVVSCRVRDNDKDDWILPKMDIQLQLPKLVAPAAPAVPSLNMHGDAGGGDGHGRVKKRVPQHNYDNSGSLTARANALSTLRIARMHVLSVTDAQPMLPQTLPCSESPSVVCLR
jgi:hypothetical protein